MSIPLVSLLMSLGGIFAGARPVLQVHSGSDAAAAIQLAIDGCPQTGCRIELPDSLYVLRNQIWIFHKDSVDLVGTCPGGRTVLSWYPGLLLRSANTLTGGGAAAIVPQVFLLRPPAGGGRPDSLPAGWLMWPYIGDVTVHGTNGPRGSIDDTVSPYSTSGFQHNGMILVKGSAFASVRHLTLDGMLPAYFVNSGIWNGRYDVFFGTVGVNFFQSLHGSVLDCELRNFWSATYLNDRNPACFATINPSDVLYDTLHRLQGCGAMGGHLFEGNAVHGNWWVAYSEAAWDLGSTFRENLAWDDRNQFLAHPGDPNFDCGGSKSSSMTENGGGFLFEKDVVYPAHVVSHNTMRGVPFIYAWNGYRASGHALWSDNLVGPIPSTWAGLGPSYSFMQIFAHTNAPTQGHVRRNTFLATDALVGKNSLNAATITDSTFFTMSKIVVDTIAGTSDTIWYTAFPTGYALAVQPDSSFSDVSHALPFLFQPSFAGDTAWFRSVDAKGITHVEKAWLPFAYDTVGYLKPPILNALGAASLDSSWWKNLYGVFTKFQSDDSSSSAYLLPAFADHNTARAVAPPYGVRGAYGLDGVVGSQVPVRVWVTGTPWWDTATAKLHLPLSIDPGSHPVDKYLVRESQLTEMHINDLSGSGILDKEARKTFPAVDPILPEATEIVLPFLPAGDSLIQIDVWLGAVSGADTLAATPVTWVWARGMRGKASGRIPTAIRAQSSRLARTGRDARGWYADLHGSADGFRLISPNGRVLRPLVEASMESTRLRFPENLAGIWFLRGPGLSLRILSVR